MSVYLDASLLVALFTNDPFTGRADAFLRAHTSVLIVSDFAAAEFASAIARLMRTQEIDVAAARLTFATFDAWTAQACMRVEAGTADIAVATAFLRRLDLPLRTPDALNIAIAQRLGATLATFDEKMAGCARGLGMPVAAA